MICKLSWYKVQRFQTLKKAIKMCYGGREG